MKFSIVITNYNNESTLERAIRSVLDQDYPNIEVICVDDASTDRSLEKIKLFEESENFIPILHEENSGSSCSRLSGIERASGDYLLFLDSDGMLTPNCCSTLASVLQKKPYDILAFAVEIEHEPVESEPDEADINAEFSPLCKDMDGESYRLAFYEERLIKHTLWNRCCSIELARKTAAVMHKDYINLYDDYYFNFVSGRYVNSYFGIPDKLIRCSCGTGIPAGDAYTETKLVQDLNSVLNVFRRCREFSQEQGLEESYFKHIELHEREQVFSFLKRIKLIPKSEHKEMIKLVLDNFGAEQFIASLSDFYEDSFNAALAESNERLAGVYASKRYKLGNILLYLPSKIKSAIWCLRHRGLRYTVSLALEKLRKAYRAAESFLKGQEEIPIVEEEKKIKFSIVITNRNNESSLERAIYSALEQDYADIELICVDDASTDRSREIIGSFENRENFIPIYLEENSGSSCSRLTGIERAGGDYLLFLDSGDMLMPNCCSALAKVLKRKACDILGFGTEPEYTVVKSQLERARLEKHFSPKRARLDSKGYRRAFYEKKQIKHDVRSKCYSIELARKAASKMQKNHINLCDDFYFSFIAALYVNSYCGTSKKLIRHRFGTGIPVADAYTKTELVQDLNSVLNVFRLCREFACEKALEETYFRYISMYEREQIFSFLERIKFLPKSEHEDMTKLILEQFGAEQFIVSLSDFCESSLKKLTDLANPGELFPYTRRAAKTVGLYCHCLCGDGPGKALCRTADYLTEAGYRVIIISDKDGSPPYCPLAEDVKRVCLGLEGCEHGDYIIRYRKLRDCIVNNRIDAFINTDFSSDFGGLDLCTVKSTGCAYMLYCHSPHVAGLIDGSSNILDKQAVYTYADAVVTLSSVDRIFWSRVNRRTFQITVPLPRVEYSAAAERRMHELLWVGKTYDKGKNPEDALEILYLVLQRMGDVTLRICGHMDDDSEKKLRGHAEQLNLGDHLIFERNKSDFSEFYSEAGLLLLTSDFEDFDTTLGLSLAHGLPVVSYELPYLAFTKQSEAVVSVPWRDFEAAAEAVLEIFQDEDRWRKMSEAARSDAEAFMAYDMPSVWREILVAVSEGKDICNIAPSEDEFWEYCDTAELTYRQASRRIGEISRGLQGVYSSKRYRLGNILLYLPSKMKDAAVYLRKQDLRHAAQLTLNRAKNLYEKFIDKIR